MNNTYSSRVFRICTQEWTHWALWEVGVLQELVVHGLNSSTQVAEAGGTLWIQGQPDIHSKFQDSHNYRVRPYLKKIFLSYQTTFQSGFYQNWALLCMVLPLGRQRQEDQEGKAHLSKSVSVRSA